MKTIKGKIYYYFNKSIPALVKLEAGRDDEGEASLLFTIKEYLIGEPYDVGFEDEVKEGSTISSNQLSGVGVSGSSYYIFENKRSIVRRLFRFLS